MRDEIAVRDRPEGPNLDTPLAETLSVAVLALVLVCAVVRPFNRPETVVAVPAAALVVATGAVPHYRLRSPATGLPAFGVGMTTSPCRAHGLGVVSPAPEALTDR